MQEPEHFDALHMLGVCAYQQGRFAEAEKSIGKAIAINPDFGIAHANLGAALHALRRHSEALVSLDRALQLKTDCAEAFNTRGNVLRDLDRLDQALADYNRALQLRPDYFEAISSRANVLLDLGRADEAMAGFDEALALNPDHTHILASRGNALLSLERPEDALANYDQLLSLTPGDAQAHKNRGIALRDLTRLDEAIASFNRALELQPAYAEARLRRGMAKLLKGEYRDGWIDYETRHEDEELAARRPSISAPVWRGENLVGRNIAIYTEQGLGDVMQFARYLPLLTGQSAKVSFVAPPRLARLLRPVTSGIEVITSLEGLDQPFDYQCALISLPLRFGTELSSIPNQLPYLTGGRRSGVTMAGKDHRASVSRSALPGRAAPGLIDQGRSIPLTRFAALSQVPNVRLISLQKKHGLDQLASLPVGMQVESLGDEFDSGPDAFIDTAAIMKNLDLIVTSDTSIAHLAGAMGRPTWIALKRVPDWRWLMDRDDSPWYPTVRLFRQRTAGDWAPVFSNIVQALRPLSGPPELSAGVHNHIRNKTSAAVAAGEHGGRMGSPPAATRRERPGIISIEALLHKAMKLHREGKVTDAEALYRRVLARDSECFDALNNLGVSAYQQGRLAEGEELLGRAVATNPDSAAAHSNRGIVLQTLGRLGEARSDFERAIEIKPDYPEAFNNHASVLRSLKHFDDALASCERALQLKPDYAEAFITRGNILRDLRRPQEALASYDRALQLRADFVEARGNCGTADGRPPREVLASDDLALPAGPDSARILINRGNALLDLNRLDEALVSFDRALAIDPAYAHAYNNRGNALLDLDRPDEALLSYDHALDLRPDYAHAHSNRGNALRDLKRLDQAIESFNRALQLKPDYAEARAIRGMVKLLAGHYREAWDDYECRWHFEPCAVCRPRLDAPPWLGENLAGRRIAIYFEQGLGDIIQFARYLPLLAQQGARVTFRAPGNLIRLLRPVTRGLEVVTSLDGLEPFDFQCGLLTLPLRLGTELSSIPDNIPYLAAEEDLTSHWREKITAGGCKIGHRLARLASRKNRPRQIHSVDRICSSGRSPRRASDQPAKSPRAGSARELARRHEGGKLGDEFDSGPDAVRRYRRRHEESGPDRDLGHFDRPLGGCVGMSNLGCSQICSRLALAAGSG